MYMCDDQLLIDYSDSDDGFVSDVSGHTTTYTGANCLSRSKYTEIQLDVRTRAGVGANRAIFDRQVEWGDFVVQKTKNRQEKSLKNKIQRRWSSHYRRELFSVQRKETLLSSSCVVPAVANDGGIKRLLHERTSAYTWRRPSSLNWKKKKKKNRTHPSSAHAIIPLPVCLCERQQPRPFHRGIDENISLIGFPSGMRKAIGSQSFQTMYEQ